MKKNLKNELSKKPKKKKGGSGRPIQGSADCFRKELDKRFPMAMTNNGFDIFRESLKEAVALRMRYTRLNVLEIPQDCIDIIEDYLGHEDYVFSFVRCAIRYYNGEKKYEIEIDTSCPTCRSKDLYKSAKHAQMDCIECNKFYLGKIRKILEKKTFNEGIDLTQRCIDIEKAILFFSNYLFSLLTKELPKKISVEEYVRIENRGKSISEFYEYNEDACSYSLKLKHTKYKSLTVDLATEIFCSRFST